MEADKVPDICHILALKRDGSIIDSCQHRGETTEDLRVFLLDRFNHIKSVTPPERLEEVNILEGWLFPQEGFREDVFHELLRRSAGEGQWHCCPGSSSPKQTEAAARLARYAANVDAQWKDTIVEQLETKENKLSETTLRHLLLLGCFPWKEVQPKLIEAYEARIDGPGEKGISQTKTLMPIDVKRAFIALAVSQLARFREGLSLTPYQKKYPIFLPAEHTWMHLLQKPQSAEIIHISDDSCGENARTPHGKASPRSLPLPTLLPTPPSLESPRRAILKRPPKKRRRVDHLQPSTELNTHQVLLQIGRLAGNDFVIVGPDDRPAPAGPGQMTLLVLREESHWMLAALRHEGRAILFNPVPSSPSIAVQRQVQEYYDIMYKDQADRFELTHSSPLYERGLGESRILVLILAWCEITGIKVDAASADVSFWECVFSQLDQPAPALQTVRQALETRLNSMDITGFPKLVSCSALKDSAGESLRRSLKTRHSALFARELTEALQNMAADEGSSILRNIRNFTDWAAQAGQESADAWAELAGVS